LQFACKSVAAQQATVKNKLLDLDSDRAGDCSEPLENLLQPRSRTWNPSSRS
jgi:hypothetical protein